MGQLAVLPSDDALAAARASVQDSVARLEAAVATATRAQNAGYMRDQLMVRASRVEQLEAKLRECEERVAAVRARAAEIAVGAEQPAAPVDAVVLAVRDVLTASKGECLACGSAVDGRVRGDRISAINAALTASDAAAQRWAALNVQWTSLQQADATARQEMALATSELAGARADVERAQVAIADAPQCDPSAVDTARKGLAAAQESLRRLEAAKAAAQVAKRADDERLTAERELVEWQQLEKECSKAIEELLDANVTAFAARVQERLPASDKFAIQLRSGARACVRMGLVDETTGRIRTALCGAEWARVMAAMADVCAPAGDALAVVVPADRGHDPETLTSVLTAFLRCDSQVIITSAVRPASVPEGWMVVDAETVKPALVDGPVPVGGTGSKKRGRKTKEVAS